MRFSAQLRNGEFSLRSTVDFRIPSISPSDTSSCATSHIRSRSRLRLDCMSL